MCINFERDLAGLIDKWTGDMKPVGIMPEEKAWLIKHGITLRLSTNKVGNIIRQEEINTDGEDSFDYGNF